MARPRKKVDEEMLRQLAAIGCVTQEMAQVLNVSKDTLERRYAAVIEKGRAQRNTSLRRMQYEVAMRGDKTMLIWLGKQFLAQRESPEDKNTELNPQLQALVAALASGPVAKKKEDAE